MDYFHQIELILALVSSLWVLPNIGEFSPNFAKLILSFVSAENVLSDIFAIDSTIWVYPSEEPAVGFILNSGLISSR